MPAEMFCPTCGQPVRALTFGQRLRVLRAQLGLSQRETAERIGVPQSTYSTYEAREGFPEEERLRKIAAGLGVPVSTLLGFTCELE
jgi:transcriptional regulator with XRE-family HTH domain